MGIHSVLEDVMAAAVSEKAKGEALERLIKVYLSQDQAWTGRFDAVWLWDEWPGRDGKPDTGIDLVARERDTGNLWAIQSKFYAPEHTLQKSDIDSFFTASGKSGFTNRILVSTTDKWSKNAEAALDGQQIPVTRLRLADLAESTIDWESYHPAKSDDVQQRPRKTPRPHQQLAISKVTEGLKALDRGKLIMACGTGKTFTSLQIAQEMVGPGGTVLFLVPSISLLQQTLREWTAEAGVPLRSFAVCSDTKVGKKAEDISVHDLMYPATTDPAKLAKAMAATASAEAMTVVFSTYQSLPVVAAAQQAGLSEFDLVICDEAHRTTGVTLAEEDDSNFVRIHDNDYLKAAKRLYMTATPRIFNDSSKSKAADAGAEVTSMDDEVTFGPELHRLGFGEAVGKGLLADYKVLVLAVDEKFVSRIFQVQLADDNHELKLDDAAKIIGCWNGLAKQRALGVDPDLGSEGQDADPEPMRRAVAFAKSIKDSQRIADLFGGIVAEYTAGAADDDPLQCSVQHVDGTFNVLERSSRLDWLKDDSDGNTCRILTNARCLSEGVDVPALDAVIFLNPRNSIVDVVQSVGRVMRRHEGKEYGYVILPVGIPAGLAPEEALADNNNFKVVWQVLNALRAHDDRFDATVNKIDLNRGSSSAIQIIGVSGPSDEDDDGTDAQRSWQAQTIPFPQIEQWRDAIYAKIVAKVGDRRYWEDWAGDIAKIAERHVTRITAILDDPDTAAAQEFESFLSGLRGNLNESITRVDAIDMLAQHLITKPVFDALFEGYSFAQHNPVSQVMQRMLDALDEHALEKESATLDAFYESVRMRAAGIDNAAGKQRIVTELYEKFFKLAFPKMADKLGIVYTPIEVVDYIINSVQHVLQTEFDSDLNDADVHVLDPFTGTGTFIVRLLESGLITPDNLARKYASELHANEILLLAYYIAAINIEATYHAVHGGPYQPFDGIVLADTFQMYEHGDRDDFDVFPENNERVIAQKKAPIRVILGNPPYSVGQSSQNDSNQNLPYPTLDSRIEGTYAAASSAGLKRNLYDSYVRAFRWASDRIGDHGVVAFVTNGAWLDNNAFDGFRKSLADEFAGIWVFNLRGNQRTSGETSRKEGGKVFGQGSRTPVAVTVLIKKADQAGPAAIHYRDIGDYLTRDEKLSILGQEVSISSGSWETLPPNDAGDWINQRDETYETYQPLGAKKDASAAPVFDLYSLGVVTNRDAWAINSSRNALLANMTRMVDYYNEQRVALGEWCHERSRPRDDAAVEAFTATVNDPAKISWTVNLKSDLRKDKPAVIDPHRIVTTMYRPYFKQRLYFDRQLNERVLQLPRMFPTPSHENLGRSQLVVARDHSCDWEVGMPGARLTAEDRAVIERGVRAGWSASRIATAIGKHRTTVAREVARGSGYKPCAVPRGSALARGVPGRPVSYRARVAQVRAQRQARRPKPSKLVGEFALVVSGLLAANWSPQQISVMLPRLFPGREDWRVSHETIYQSLFVQTRGELRRELAAHLRSGRTHRKTRGSAPGRGKLTGMISIRERPAEAEDRAVPGHWEGDLLMGGIGKGAVITLVERSTRFVLLAPLPDSHKAIDVREVLTAMIATLPAQLRRTLTWDQGKEMAEHAQITIDAGIDIYFCDPHSPWQRGSNENTNGLLRQYWPKGCDMRNLTQADCDEVALSLNTRPRQTLAWQTPQQALDEALRATAA